MSQERVTNAVLANKISNMDDNIQKRVDELAELVERHDSILRGNGKPGLQESVNSNTKTLASINKGMWLIGGSILLEIVGRIMGLL